MKQATTVTSTRRAVSVEVDHISKAYNGLTVLDDVSLSIHPGEIFVIMGPSGAGKSVLLRSMIGLDRPSQGRVLLNGLDAAEEETHEQIVTSIVFQAGALFNSMSVFDNLALYPTEHRLYNKNILKEKIAYILDILSLNGAVYKMPSELSGGMKKRVAIARALMMEPQLILYDEPTSELDPIMSANITEVIGTLKEKFDVTSVVVSHDRDMALAIADRIAILMDGHIHTVDTPEGIKKSQNTAVKEFMNPIVDIKNPRFGHHSPKAYL